MTSSIDGRPSSASETLSVCPSITGTLVVCALTTIGCGVTRVPSSCPRIFCVSLSIFSSSPEIAGTTLPMMSSEATPGYPAPDTACIVVTITDRMPN